jgi:hypothetical protein
MNPYLADILIALGGVACALGLTFVVLYILLDDERGQR